MGHPWHEKVKIYVLADARRAVLNLILATEEAILTVLWFAQEA